MSIPKNSLKRVRDIRSHVANIAQVSSFMRLLCIEMQKTRLDKENENIESRQKSICLRLQKINEEKAILLGAVNKLDDGANFVKVQSVKPEQNEGVFKVKY